MSTRLSTIEEVSEYSSEESDRMQVTSGQYQASGEESIYYYGDDLSHWWLVQQEEEPSMIGLLGKRATLEQNTVEQSGEESKKSQKRRRDLKEDHK